ncbi:MAG: hypothetical protein ACPGJS_18605 [Flammeovirgaceae bacterium]
MRIATIPPKKWLLIDGCGALLSAFLLGMVLTKFQDFFGMPLRELYFLAALPCLFAIYDFTCYFFLTANWKTYLKYIAIANLMYTIISMGLVMYNYQKLTIFGILYFGSELIIILILVRFELKAATQV